MEAVGLALDWQWKDYLVSLSLPCFFLPWKEGVGASIEKSLFLNFSIRENLVYSMWDLVKELLAKTLTVYPLSSANPYISSLP